MNKRKSKKLFYKKVTKALLSESYIVAYVNPYIINQVVKKVRETHKVKTHILFT